MQALHLQYFWQDAQISQNQHIKHMEGQFVYSGISDNINFQYYVPAILTQRQIDSLNNKSIFEDNSFYMDIPNNFEDSLFFNNGIDSILFNGKWYKIENK